MRSDARIQTTIEILTACLNSPRGADFVVQQQLRQRRYMGGGDRRSVKERFYSCLRQWGGLCWRLDMDPTCKTLPVRMIVALQAVLSEGEGALSLFSGQAHAPEVLSPEEEAALRCAFTRTSAPEHAVMNLPDWLWSDLKSAYGPDAVSLIAALNQPAPLDIRLFSHQDREAYLSAAQHSGHQARAIPHAPYGVRFQQNIPHGHMPLAKDGAFIVQDAGSQIVAEMTHIDMSDGARGWDVCAGGGGKTLALLDRMGANATLCASDVGDSRLMEARRRLSSSCLSDVSVDWVVLAPDWDDPKTSIPPEVGAVTWALIDAPCSGVGAWRRAPFARWRLGADDVARYVQTQAALLDRVADYMPIGGHITYVTCSVLPQENTQQISDFLVRHSGYRSVSLADKAQSLGLNQPSDLDSVLLRPDMHNVDGFFIATVQRVS